MNQWVLISNGWKLKATIGRRRGVRESVRERLKQWVEFIGMMSLEREKSGFG